MFQVFITQLISAFLVPTLPFILIIILQFADLISTVIARKKGFIEANPIENFIQNKLGLIPGMVVSKILVILISAFATSTFQWIIVVLMLIIIINNIDQLRK